jgi:hypothetical protein
LVDTSGASTSVTLAVVGGTQDFEASNPGTMGDDDSLLDDLFDASTSTWTFSGLSDGNYDVYVYAWAPDNPTFYYSDVTVQAGSGGTQRIGGIAWSGTFVQGSGTTSPPSIPGHYHKDRVTISGGSSLVVDIAIPAPPALMTPTSVNGFQIVPVPTPPSFCTAKTTTNCGAANISSSGTSSATASGGFIVCAGPTRGCRSGLLLYSSQPVVPGVPFGGPGDGLLCLSPGGLRRAGPIDSGGTSPAICDGMMAIDMNAFTALGWNAVGCGPPPGQNSPAAFLALPGVLVAAQVWGRDSVANGQVVSDGLSWIIGP